MNVLQASLRLGNRDGSILVPVGLVQKISWGVTRKSTEIYQVEAIPDTIDSDPSVVDLTVPGQFENIQKYWPGEPLEVIPFTQDVIEMTLDRTVTNYGTGLEALLNVGGAAEYSTDAGVSTYDASEGRAVTPLQQVRPFNIYSIFYSPTQIGRRIYGVAFQDCWVQDVSGWDIDSKGDGVIIESIKARCPRIRLFRDAA
jgi:hypothetical protein